MPRAVCAWPSPSSCSRRSCTAESLPSPNHYHAVNRCPQYTMRAATVVACPTSLAIRAIVLRQPCHHRRRVDRARGHDDGDARLWQHRNRIGDALGVEFLRQNRMRIDTRQDEAGTVGPAHGLECTRRALDAALHHLIVVVGANGLAVGAEGDDVADPVIAPGVVDIVRLEIVVELRL